MFVERNYIFQSHVIFINFDAKRNIMTHIMNNNFSFVHVRNATNKFIILSKHIKLNKLFDYDEKNCYHANVSKVHLIVDINWKRRALTTLIDIIVIVVSFLIEMTFIHISTTIINFMTKISQIYVVVSISSFEFITSIDIIIYDTSSKI